MTGPMPGAQRHPLPGGRWHWQHGPIDIVLWAEGDAAAVAAAHQQAWQRFEGLLAELVAELPLLRQPVAAGPGAMNPLRGPVARSMWQACQPLVAAAQGFLTPMAAVAGAVAQALIAHYQRPGIERAWVNNGGDIALHLAPGQHLRTGIVADLGARDGQALARTAAGQAAPDAQFNVYAADPVRGIATSGWRGRSFSLGVADAVTVLAATAAQADAAATVVANAVDLAHPGIVRRPASTLRDDSDLGDRLVTVQVPRLSPSERQAALARGLACAQALQQAGLLHAALLWCQGSCAELVRAPALELV